MQNQANKRIHWGLVVIFMFTLTTLFHGCAQRQEPNRQEITQKSGWEEGLRHIMGLVVDRQWEYAGEGNEYATFSAQVSYAQGNRYQIMENNGGTILARVLELQETGAYEILTRGEHYEQQNLLTDPALSQRSKLEDKKLLPWPITTQQKWVLPDGSAAEVISTTSKHTVPAGTFTNVVHIRIRTIHNNAGELAPSPVTTVQDIYYAPDIGLIERRFQQGDTVITSRLRSYS
jgi:hypothetical protein